MRLDGLLAIASEVGLHELEPYRITAPIDMADIQVRIGRVQRPDLPAPDVRRVVYDEGLGPLGFRCRIDLGETIRVTVSPLLRLSPHVLYTNMVEPIMRWTFVSRGFALVHGACLAWGEAAYLITALTDTGKTTTVLKLLNKSRPGDPAAFISDDLMLLSPAGQVYTFPKPMTLSAHTLHAIYPDLPGLGAAFTATPATLAQQMITSSQSQTVFVERTPEVGDAFAFDFLFPGTPVQRLDFRQCLPQTDGRATATTYVVLAAHDPRSASMLQALYPDATVTQIEPETAALVGELQVVDVPAGAQRPAPQHPASATVADGVRLLGYDWSGPVVKAGQPLYLTLYWKADSDQQTQNTAFAHLGQGTDEPPEVAAHDGEPCQGLYPTTRWRAGDVVPDSFAIPIPATATPGTYPLLAGWYDTQT